MLWNKLKAIDALWLSVWIGDQNIWVSKPAGLWVVDFNLFSSETDHVVFDNSYSYFKNKRILYSVTLSAPVIIEEIEQAADKLDAKVIDWIRGGLLGGLCFSSFEMTYR